MLGNVGLGNSIAWKFTYFEIHLLGNSVLGSVGFLQYLLQCYTQKAYVLPDIMKPMLNLFYGYEALWWLTLLLSACLLSHFTFISRKAILTLSLSVLLRLS